MKEYIVGAYSLPNAYHEALRTLWKEGKKVPCPDYDTTQLEVSLTMNVLNPLAEPRISKLFIGDPYSLEQYRQEILDGILDFEIDKGNWAYTYHSRIAPQVPFIVEDLKRNPYSRRAVIDVRDIDHDMGSENPACLQHIQYFIRDNKLYCKVLFRSNDACKATFMNAFALIELQKRIADELGVGMGEYSHRANSFHCYEKDFSMLEGYCKRICTAEKIEDLTYDYVGEWDELMEEARDGIAKKVEELKNR